MSMLSAQCAELRWLAEHLDERERGMDEYVTALRDAADTIWELRGSVHRERAEADRLRASNEVIAEDHAALCEQNAKLRELVQDMWRDGMCDCDERGACAGCEYHFPDRMRELGVEV